MSRLHDLMVELRRLAEAKAQSLDDLQPQIEQAMAALEQATTNVMATMEALPNAHPRQVAQHTATIVRSLELATAAWEKVDDAVKEMR